MYHPDSTVAPPGLLLSCSFASAPTDSGSSFVSGVFGTENTCGRGHRTDGSIGTHGALIDYLCMLVRTVMLEVALLVMHFIVVDLPHFPLYHQNNTIKMVLGLLRWFKVWICRFRLRF